MTATTRRTGWWTSLRHLPRHLPRHLLHVVLRRVVGGVLAGRRPHPARLGYDAALAAGEAALTQIACSRDALVRELALLQLRAAHEAASVLADAVPADDPTVGELGPAGRRGRRDQGMWQVHRITARLCEHLAATERSQRQRRLAAAAAQPGEAGASGAVGEFTLAPDPLEWARPLAGLAVTADPRERARLVLTLGVLVDDGGRVTDQMHGIAVAYLRLAGDDPAAITTLYEEIAGATVFGPTFATVPATVAAQRRSCR